MNLERWTRVEEIYHSVLSCPPDARAGVLESSCDGDAELRLELESLLAARDEAGDFLSAADLREQVAQLASESVPSLEGQILGPYRVISQIGRGGMGVVYRAVDTRLERPVALKVLPGYFSDGDERVERFRREAKAASALNHPGIVTIYDIGQEGGTWFIAAEFVDGISLRQRLQAGRIPLPDVYAIARQCAAALQAAHCAVVVHRDIKPENIMLRPDGTVKLVDFGLASMAGASENPDQPGGHQAIVGTPRYMSPEQARGLSLDARTDIFSLASVSYEMATGEVAFPGTTTAETIAALVGDVDPLSNSKSLNRRMAAVLRRALAKERATRYQTMEEFAKALERADSRRYIASSRSRAVFLLAGLILVVLLLAWSLLERRRDHWRRPTLSGQDTTLLADFNNQTGDPVFEPTLRQGLAVHLEQSPFITTLADARTRETLQMMGRQPDARITPELGREICIRKGLKALVTGSIASLGSHYAITLEATDSHTGAALARAQTEASSKEDVLRALSKAADKLREELGESLSSIQKFDALLERTTSSLEALQAYSLGYQERRQGKLKQAMPFFLKAVELDPQFAYAYSDLATAYRNLDRFPKAVECATKAYALRDRVSERERLRILSVYYEYVTREVEKNIETLKLYEQIYPRDPLPHNNIVSSYSALGDFEMALQESRAAMRLDPDTATRFVNESNELIHLNRFSEARELCLRAIDRKRDGMRAHLNLYRIAFVADDRAEMERQLDWVAGKSDVYQRFESEAAASAFEGEWSVSRQQARRAAQAALQSGGPELASFLQARSALRGAALEQCAEAKLILGETVALELTRSPVPRAALAQDLCGERMDPQALGWTHRYAKDTVLNSVWFPVLRAAADLRKRNYAAVIENLRTTGPFEGAGEFWPQFLRGQAYLHMKKGTESAAEFSRIRDHRGQAVDSPLYPLAELGLARASRLLGNTKQARKDYQAFFAAWAKADADLPELVKARSEFVQLK